MPIRQDAYRLPDDGLTGALQATLSPPRLSKYMVAANFDPKRATQFYVWNIALGQSFHFPLHVAEVCLRNRIHNVLSDVFDPNWVNNADFVRSLDQHRMADIAQAQDRLTRQRKPLVIDRIVAKLSFGFWVGMFDGRYNPRIWSSHLRSTFPHLPNNLTRSDVYERVKEISGLRNRIFHHEPIFQDDNSFNYRQITQLLAWMCPSTLAWVRDQASVPFVIRQKPKQAPKTEPG